MPRKRIKPEINEFIEEHKDLYSNRVMAREIMLKFNTKVSREYIRQYVSNLLISSDNNDNNGDNKKIVVSSQEPKVIAKKQNPLPPVNFNDFIKKLEQSDSFSAKLLKQKLGVKGKFKKINVDRVVRIIRLTLDIVQE